MNSHGTQDGVHPGIHSCSLGAPILLEEAKAAGVRPPGTPIQGKRPSCIRCERSGQWIRRGIAFYNLTRVRTRYSQSWRRRRALLRAGCCRPKTRISEHRLDASITHMYAPGRAATSQRLSSSGQPWRRSWSADSSASSRAFRRATSACRF